MRTVLRSGLAVLAAAELVLGAWTLFLPASFYADVPTVDLTPPYSEHLFRDFGGATLGLALALAAAAVWLDKRLVVVALLAYLAFSLPHLVFHLDHLSGATARRGAAAGDGPGRLRRPPAGPAPGRRPPACPVTRTEGPRQIARALVRAGPGGARRVCVTVTAFGAVPSIGSGGTDPGAGRVGSGTRRWSYDLQRSSDPARQAFTASRGRA